MSFRLKFYSRERAFPRNVTSRLRGSVQLALTRVQSGSKLIEIFVNQRRFFPIDFPTNLSKTFHFRRNQNSFTIDDLSARDSSKAKSKIVPCSIGYKNDVPIDQRTVDKALSEI